MPVDGSDAAVQHHAPLRLCLSGPVLFFCRSFGLRIVCSGLAGHCARLILALVETIEYCRTGGGRRKRLWESEGFSLTLSVLAACERKRGGFDLILTRRSDRCFPEKCRFFSVCHPLSSCIYLLLTFRGLTGAGKP